MRTLRPTLTNINLKPPKPQTVSPKAPMHYYYCYYYYYYLLLLLLLSLLYSLNQILVEVTWKIMELSVLRFWGWVMCALRPRAHVPR